MKPKKPVPFVPGLVRDTPPPSPKSRALEPARAPAAELRPAPNRLCPVCGRAHAVIAVEIWAVQAFICQQCFNTYVAPLEQAKAAAGGLLDLLNRFL